MGIDKLLLNGALNLEVAQAELKDIAVEIQGKSYLELTSAAANIIQLEEGKDPTLLAVYNSNSVRDQAGRYLVALLRDQFSYSQVSRSDSQAKFYVLKNEQ